MSLKATSKFNIEKPQPGMLLPGHPGWVNSYKQHFWTGADRRDLGQQPDPYTTTILGTWSY